MKPAELLKLHRAGVEIWSCLNLHAKVFVFGHTAFVGSTNVSTLSSDYLLEAAIETTARNVVDACRSFVENLRGDRVTEEDLLELTKIRVTSRPRVRLPRRSGPLHSPIWAVPLTKLDLEDVDELNLDRAHASAETQADPAADRLDSFVWYGKSFVTRLERGHRVVLCERYPGEPKTVSPPGRILNIRRYRGPRGVRAAVAVAFPKGKRAPVLTTVVDRLGSAANPLKTLKGPRALRDQALVVSLGQLWASKK